MVQGRSVAAAFRLAGATIESPRSIPRCAAVAERPLTPPNPPHEPDAVLKMLSECNTRQQHSVARSKRLKRRQLLVFFASRQGGRAADCSTEIGCSRLSPGLLAVEVGLTL
jgi:hypothetical protein